MSVQNIIFALLLFFRSAFFGFAAPRPSFLRLSRGIHSSRSLLSKRTPTRPNVSLQAGRKNGLARQSGIAAQPFIRRLGDMWTNYAHGPIPQLRGRKLQLDGNFGFGFENGGQSTVLRFFDKIDQMDPQKRVAVKVFNKERLIRRTRGYLNDVLIPLACGGDPSNNILMPLAWRLGDHKYQRCAQMILDRDTTINELPKDTWKHNLPALSRASVTQQIDEARETDNRFTKHIF